MTFYVAGAMVVSSVVGSRASSKAANVQAAAADRAAEGQERMFERQVELSEPWRKAGMNALAKLEPLATEYTPFGMQQFQADPGYAFRMSEGMKGLERSAAARGGLLSGATLKGIQRFGQDLGSQEYMNAFNRYQTERAARLQPLQSLAGVGQTTAQQIGQAGMQAAQNIGQTQMGGAAARASGYVGGANALTGALGTYLNYSQGQNMINAMRTPTAAPTVAAPAAPNIGYQDPYAGFRYGSST
jgi:hypothetical protein